VKRCAAALLLGLALAPALPAQGDDRSLREAGDSRDAQAARLGERWRRAYEAWERSGFSRRWARRVNRINRAARRSIAIVTEAVRGERPSSRHGRTYKREVLRSNRTLAAGLRWDARAVSRWTRGRGAAARVAWRRAERLFARSGRHARRARRAIRRALPP
jgi:hypothetical protein